jgi:hypothetical protein
MKLERSRLIVLVSLLAALDIILSLVPIYPVGPSIAAIMKPFEGIMLGPLGGALAAFLGGVIATFIWPGSAALLYATWIPGLVGALGAGMLFTRRWYLSFALLMAVIVGFLLHPWGSSVFIYANWDKIIALVLIMPASRMVERTLRDRTNLKSLPWSVGMVAFISTEMDAATGNLIFLFLAQAGLYGPMTSEGLLPLFLPYVLVDPAVRLGVGIAAALILAPVLYTCEKANILKWPLT